MEWLIYVVSKKIISILSSVQTKLNSNWSQSGPKIFDPK
jgi:Flp pilus assembly pilin Flp